MYLILILNTKIHYTKIQEYIKYKIEIDVDHTIHE